MENILLLLAVILCGSSSLLSLFCVSKRIRTLAYILWCLTVLSITISVLLMITYLISSRFEFQYVYSHSSLDTALIYRISSLWSGQEGSFLLWALILGIMGFFVLRLKGSGRQKSFGIYSAISFCIFLMCLITQPFAKTEFMFSDGLGLTAALKDPWMVVHPPLVFISYSAMAVLFSLFPSLKNSSEPDAFDLIITWLRISWFFLGLGIFSGSIWAYRALGWGGYWAWDPIENAALVPWLIICSFLHQKRYNFGAVCFIPFTVACFGVFLARSGILKDQSSHAYAQGNIIVTGIITTFILAVILFLAITSFRKRHTVKLINGLNKFSSLFMHNSINIYAGLIFLGTISPIIFKYDTPISYYALVSIAFVLIYSFNLLLLDKEWLKRKSTLMIVGSTVLIIGIIILFHTAEVWWLLLIWLVFMPLSLWLVCGFRTKRRNYYLCHIGVVLLIIGAISSSSLGTKAYIIVNPAVSKIIEIEGLNIPVTELTKGDMLIKSLPTKDLLIQSSQMLTLQQGDLMIPYITKPLIILFWLGSFIIIAQPLILIIIDRLSRKH
ncbi:MAG TPA: cytochrome c biogenesis protein CcsA [Lachnospiraceae bacterium]|nr:cytochrome c biogenesis protein CcsA [Lachnospiraceae bacterium]